MDARKKGGRRRPESDYEPQPSKDNADDKSRERKSEKKGNAFGLFYYSVRDGENSDRLASAVSPCASSRLDMTGVLQWISPNCDPITRSKQRPAHNREFHRKEG